MKARWLREKEREWGREDEEGERKEKGGGKGEREEEGTEKFGG